MAQNELQDLLDRWRKAEAKYRVAADAVLDKGAKGLDKSLVVELTKARVRADKRMQDFLKRSVG